MRRYIKLSSIEPSHFVDILNFFFNRCDKVNIYFPTITDSTEILDFKAKFLATTHIIEDEEELSALEDTLEEKEGFSMIIASLTQEVKALLPQMKPHLHLSLGLIEEDKVLLYLGDEDECVIEADEESDIFSSPLFSSFITI